MGEATGLAAYCLLAAPEHVTEGTVPLKTDNSKNERVKEKGGRRLGSLWVTGREEINRGSNRALAAAHDQLPFSDLSHRGKHALAAEELPPRPADHGDYSRPGHSSYFCLFSVFPKWFSLEVGPWSAYEFLKSASKSKLYSTDVFQLIAR